MNDHERDRYEAELRRMTPAPAPVEFMARLRAAKPVPAAVKTASRKLAWDGVSWWKILGWATPALAAALSVLLFVTPRVAQPAKSGGGLRVADDVKVDHQLVTSFDVVATLPDGQPVRFRCHRWNDQMVVTDKRSGLEIEQSNPRVVVTPVRFETY